MTVTAEGVRVPLAKVVRYPAVRRGWNAFRMNGNALKRTISKREITSEAASRYALYSVCLDVYQQL